MPKRTLVVLAMAAFGAMALPFGLPTIAHASGTAYDSIAIKPLPLEQPGTLTAVGPGNTATACVQPLAGGHPVVGAIIFMSIDPGLFTAPVAAGGSATANGTLLTPTPQQITTTSNTCTWSNNEGTGTLTDAIEVDYTGPNPKPVNGRDVIGATSDGTSFDAANGQCTGSGVCNTTTYVFSPVASYSFTPVAPIAPAGSLTPGENVTFTVTALDGTSHAVPGAFIDLSLTTTASAPGTATGVNSFDGNTAQKVNDLPTRYGATNAGTVSVTYTASGATSGTDTITAQNHPTETVEDSTFYTYGSSAAFSQGPYTAITPFRVCDTRPPGHGIIDNQCDFGSGPIGPIGKAQSRAVTIEGEGVVPATGVTAVVVNLTAIAPTLNSLVSLYPAGGSLPATSNVNPFAGQVVANLVEVGIGTGGQIEVYNAVGTINVALDVEGYVSSGSPGYFNAVAPTRICDTRVGPGISPNQCNAHGHNQIGTTTPLNFNISQSGSPIPTSGVTAVVFNLTAISPTARTVLTAAPGDVSVKPSVSNLNLNPGTAVPNRVIVGVPSGCTTNCTVNIWNGVGLVDVAIDVDGWFGTSSTPPASQFTALVPSRICDTQKGTPGTSGCQVAGTLGAGHVLNIFVDGAGGIPTLGSTHQPVAIAVNVTAVNATTSTFVSVYPGPASAAIPRTSDLNEPTFAPVTNLVIVKVGADGSINLYNALGNVNVIVDVMGYYS